MRFDAWPAVWLLLLVPLVLLLYARAFARQRQALAAFVAADLAPLLLPGTGARRRWGRALCLCGVLACLIIALMQPRWGEGAREVPRLGRDVIVLLDVSYSMLAEDAAPDRLTRAKAAIRALAVAVQRDGGHRLALIGFAGRADVLCPLTRDYGLFRKRLEDASADAVARRGTALGEALRQAVRALGELAPGYTDLVLVSDGEDHAGLALEAAAMLGGLGLRLHTAGVGDPDRTVPIPVGDGKVGRDHLVQDGQEVRTRLRSGLLIGMADAADGVYVPLADAEVGLDGLYAEEIAGAPRRALKAAADRELKPRYQLLLLIALALLALEILLRATPRGAGMPAAPRAAQLRLGAGLLAFLPLLGGDQAERAVREGNALYAAGRYEAALEQYEAAAERLPEAPVIDFNRGNALFKAKDQEQALDRYLAALDSDDPALAGRAKYNIGVIKYRQALAAAQRYEDALTLAHAAVRYFRESLELAPGLADARFNLELAYRFRHEIEQQMRRNEENAQQPANRSSLRRGQAFSDQIRNEGGGLRQSLPDQARRPHGQRGNQTPENFAANQESSDPPKSARLPMAMGPDVAQQLMEQLRERLAAAEVRRQEQRRQRLQQADEAMPW